VSDILDLKVERPVAGGRMLARDNGRVIFVAGAIPGERVRARIVGATKHAVFASVMDVLDASPDRRTPAHDPLCGGADFAHIAYARQLTLKREILIDAFRRLARLTIDPPPVAASPEQGYRLRSRLHVSAGRVGYFLEGTHTICDAAATRQLLPDATRLAQALVATIDPGGQACDAVIVSENIAASERVLHLEWRAGADVRASWRARPPLPPRWTASRASRWSKWISARPRRARGSCRRWHGALWIRTSVRCADPLVASPVVVLSSQPLSGRLSRQRVLTPRPAIASSTCTRASGCSRWPWPLVVPVSPRSKASGLPSRPPPQCRAVVRPPGGRRRTRRGHCQASAPVRARRGGRGSTRTGLSTVAQTGVAAWRAPRVVYVSCDPPTLARDAAKFVAAGYTLAALEAFDLFRIPRTSRRWLYSSGRLGVFPRKRNQFPAVFAETRSFSRKTTPGPNKPANNIVQTDSWAAVAVVAVPVMLLADRPTPDKIPATGGDITIAPINHATLQITHATHVIDVDPVGGGRQFRRTRGADDHSDHRHSRRPYGCGDGRQTAQAGHEDRGAASRATASKIEA
jgi:23S rRNA (uracil1939-C5)-methyltransferase